MVVVFHPAVHVKIFKTNNMNAICPNCKAKLSCGCQRRSASDGAAVCTLCITQYESTLRTTKGLPPLKPTPVFPHERVLKKDGTNDPEIKRVTYNPPGL